VITSGRLVRTKSDPGLAMRLAVYKNEMPLATVDQRRAAYMGSVGAGFNVRRLMSGALGPNGPAYLRYRLYDAGLIGEQRAAAQPRAEELLFDGDSLGQTTSNETWKAGAEFSVALPMEVGGRVWQLHFRAPRGAAVGGLGLLLPWMVLGAGIFASGLLFAMFQAVVSSRSRAVSTAEELRQRSAQLEEAVAELESFSYTVSHDLRAPLRHMSGYAGMLREGGAELGAEARARYLASIAEAATKMGALVDDLLAFSRTSRAPLKVGRVDLGALVEDVRRECLREVGERSIEWRIPRLPAVEADPTLLRIALVNLVGNAVKFTARRQQAVIEIGAEDGDDGRVLLYVRDNGTGFEMRYADKLFGVFQRLHGDEFPGTGIGLVTVQRIVQRHGGRIWAQAAPDAGATFHFTLKRAP
jgi:signal transduction histidine kinase